MNKLFQRLVGLALGYLLLHANVYAQPESSDPVMDEIVVVGSHVSGATTDGILPVTLLDEEDIALTGAATGDELLRSIPQIGEVAFNNERDIGGVNDARGDVASINLRGLGTGNTLTLLNGRRLVLHPATQTENFVPVVTVNANTLPVKGIQRIEVLRDGAAAIYGADAVAGVINYVLRDDYEGSEASLRYSSADNSNLDETTFNAASGFFFNQGRSHLTLTGSYYHRDPMFATDRPYSRTEDLRDYPTLPNRFVGDSQLRNRSSSAPWGIFDSPSGRFRIQPDTLSGCDVSLANGVCRNTTTSGSLPDELRFDAARQRTMSSEVDRFNFTSMLNHELSDNLELFGELLYYQAESNRQREQSGVLTAQRFTIADTAALNPFGETVTVRSYRPIDAGGRDIDVEDTSYRILGGLRGNFSADWQWEGAVLYSEAESHDKAHNRIRADLFQAAVNSTDPNTAYDIFNGGDLANPNFFDATANPESVINPFLVSVSRESESILTLADFKVTNNDVFTLPAGGVGIAAGVEWREEEFADDRDPLLDGSTPFIDLNTSELLSNSNVLGSSPTPDTEGDRRVTSLFVELLVPVLDSIDVQLAGRYENFSDVGSEFTPKIAFSWAVTDSWHFRGAYSEGYRAPNLAQVSDPGTVRVNTRQDPVQGGSQSVENVRSGSDDLEPEEDENLTFGFVWEPLPEALITVDWWQIEQDGVIGILGDQNHILYDSLLRADFGTTNPNVVREPTNEILFVVDEYLNLLPRTIEGVDLSVRVDLDTDDAGTFRFSFNGSYLSRFDQETDAISQQLINAQNAGNPAVPVSINVGNAGSLVKEEGRPRWRHAISMNWRLGPWSAGVSSNYIGDFYDPSVTTSSGEPLPVKSYRQYNLLAGYDFQNGGILADTSLRLGVRNILNEDPPLADESFGYASDVHSNRGRQVYVDINKHF